MATENGPAGLSHLQPMPADASQRLVTQVARHVELLLTGQEIDAGGRLPSERTVAIDLGVSRNTVTAAYGELEQRGLLRRIRGKGAFKCFPSSPGDSFSWSGKVSSKAHLLDEPVLEMLARSCSSGLPHPLSAGTPSLECFPTVEYRECVNRVVDRDFPKALAVAPTEGQWRLREAIGKWMSIAPNRIMITSGGQEAIDLLSRCLIEPGDHAIVENPTYPGAIQCLRAAGARLIGWDTDWSLTKLEQLFLRYTPKLLFTTPTFQNPTGKIMPLAVRQGLLDLAARYHVAIIEDDVYSRTYMDGQPPPECLLKLDKHGVVICLSTFSKMLAPGLRVGWMIAPAYMIKQLSLIKMRANLFTGGLNQLVLTELIESGGFEHHLVKMRAHHRGLRDVAIAAVQPAVDEGLLSYAAPAGGLYLWCKLDANIDVDTLLGVAEERGVSFAPGYAFFPGKTGQNYFRLCYTGTSAARVKKGIEILTRVLREAQEEAIQSVESSDDLRPAMS